MDADNHFTSLLKRALSHNPRAGTQSFSLGLGWFDRAQVDRLRSSLSCHRSLFPLFLLLLLKEHYGVLALGYPLLVLKSLPVTPGTLPRLGILASCLVLVLSVFVIFP